MEAWGRAPAAFPDEPLHHQFRRVAQERPGAIAVSDGEGALTYGELDRKSRQLSAALATMGIGRGDRVGVFTGRGTDLLVALFGVLGSGAAMYRSSLPTRQNGLAS